MMKQLIELNKGFAYFRKPTSELSMEDGTCINEGCSNERPAMTWVDANGNTTGREYTNDTCYTCAAQSTTKQTTIEKVENTMTTQTTTQQAEAIIENIKAGNTAGTVTAVKAFDIKGAISTAWAAIKAFDYKAAANKAFDKAMAVYDAVDVWFTTTKTGKTTGYVLGATTVMTCVGLFAGTAATVLVGAAIHTAYNTAYASKNISVSKAIKELVINTVLYAAIVAVAFLVVPLALAFIADAFSTAVLLTVIPFYSIFL